MQQKILLLGHPRHCQIEAAKLQKEGISVIQRKPDTALYILKELVSDQDISFIMNVATPFLGTCHRADELSKVERPLKIFGINIPKNELGFRPKGMGKIIWAACSTEILREIKNEVVEQN